ncbi:MAG: LysM peptidoglycan-binding domain-containing protein [Elusimicrobia bacterium]|nr:LysM peptidoglycan-binding domain-containing protein [Elusimicrobiota bacterium]
MLKPLRSLIVICFAAALNAQESRYFQNVTILPGDTLWSLAQRYLKDPKRWPEILKHNTLPNSDPTVALPGQTLKIPVLLIKDELRAAKLFEAVNTVEYRRRQAAEWTRARPDIELYQEDGLRTGSVSQAKVRFAVGEDLTLESNSFAIIRPDRLTEDLGRGVSLVSGALRSRGVRLLTQTARVIPRTKETDFHARIRDDLATIVEVFRGITDVEAKGQSLTVREGFGTVVPVGGAPEKPLPLPPLPKTGAAPEPGRAQGVDADLIRAQAAADGFVIRDGQLTFRGGASKGPASEGSEASVMNNFHIQIARDPNESTIVWEDSQALTRDLSFGRIGLKDGVYYFRVAFRDRLGFEGPYSPWRRMTVDTKPPDLVVEQPPASERTVDENPVLIAGLTEPKALVTIESRPVTVGEDGRFQTRWPLNPGRNYLHLAAVDESGNRTDEDLLLIYEGQGIGAKGSGSLLAERAVGEDEEETGRKFSPQAEKLATVGLGLAAAAVIASVIILLLL